MDLFQIVAIVLSLAFTVVAVVLTTQAVKSILAVVRTGGKSMDRSENPVGRTVTMVKETMLHTRMLQWTVVGVMHWFVYFAFIVLGAAVFTAYFQLFSPEFQLPIVGHFFLYEWLGETLGVLGSIGILYLAYYRQKHHPRREGRNSRFYRSTMWQAYFVEAMALIEGSLILFIRGAEYNLGKVVHSTGEDADHYTRFHFPVSSFFGDVLYGTDRQTLETTIIAIGMMKIVLAMIWLVVIARNLTMGVAWHRFTAWFNIWFKREPSGRTALGAMKPLTSDGKAITLDDIDDLDEDSKLGVGALEDFSWKNILDFTTCTECGRCQSQCPAWNTEKPLNPKLLITALRDATYAKAPYTRAVQDGGEEAGVALLEGNDTLTREVERPLVGDVPEGEWFYNPESGAAVIDSEVLWNCTSCGACVQQCPVDIEHVDHIMDMRRYAVLVESNFPAQLNGLFKGLENKGNPWNMSSTARMDWAKGLDFEVKVVGETIESLDEVDWLFWVGCAGAYEDRAKKTTRAVAELLDMAGISFGVLGNGETCTGDPARRAGNEFVFQGLAQENVATLTEAKAKKVVSTCAHCFNTLKNEYKDFGIELEVIHHTQLLNRLVREGKLTPVNDGAGAHKRSITYHDPCYIGRHNGVYEPPRELLQVLPGAQVVEMERNSERSFCCGAGGARMWMEENIGSRINVNRTIEAVGTGADQIAVGCPFCRVMLSDGLTAQQAKGEAREEVEVLDVAQMLLASVKGEMATKLAPGASEAAGTVSAKAAPGAPAADKTSEETRAEPSPGDDTQTVDPDNTVTDTADAGPLAKASGGSSLFDAPAEPETAAKDSTPAEEAQAAKPASSGGSLFDVSGDDDTADAADEPAPAEAAAPDADAAAPTPAAGGDLGSGGSLFDVGGNAEATPEATPAPDTAKPAAEVAPAPADEAEADADLAKAPAKPAADLGSGGSLFDIASPEPAAAEAPAAPAAKAAAPAAGTGSTSTPGTAIPTSGSLFDIGAPETVEPAATPAEPEPVAEAEPAAEPEHAAEPEPAAEEPAELEPVATTTTPASSGTSSTPGTEIPEGGSLFDLEAPATETVDRPAAAAEPEPTPEPEPEPEPTDKVDAEPQPEPDPTPEPTDEVDAEPTPEPEPTDEVAAEPDVQPEPAATTTAPASSGAASTPGTEIPDGGSLFDIQAPAVAPVERAAAPTPTAEAEPEATADVEPEPEPTPEPTADVEPEPAATTEPEGDLTPAQQVSAAATAAANNGEDEPVAPEAEAIVEETPDETDDAEADAQEALADAEVVEEADSKANSKANSTADDEAEPDAQAPADDEPKPASSGATHTPKTGVDITEAGSLFDL